MCSKFAGTPEFSIQNCLFDTIGVLAIELYAGKSDPIGRKNGKIGFGRFLKNPHQTFQTIR